MTNWQPDLASRRGPKYRAIAEAIATDIADGRLTPGDKLPPLRDLAWTLGVTVGTVGRGYAEAERNGLVKGTVGSGTYVLRPGTRQIYPTALEPESGVVDMSMAAPPPGAEAGHFADALRRIADDPNAAALLGPPGGAPRNRAAGAAWLARTGIEVPPDNIVVTAGAQHGIAVTFAALAQPGDRIATECLTYNGVKAVATMLGIKLEGLPIDAHGIVPDAFEDACRRGTLRALYCIPGGHNPTTVTMPDARREAIAAIALRHGVPVIEDDIFTPLLPSRPAPLSPMVGDLGVCITSLSKAVAPGLRIGFVSGPASMVDRLRVGVRSTCWAATPLTAEIAAQWIEDGTVDTILESRVAESKARLGLVREILGGYAFDSVPGHVYAWLHLPEPWRANDFVAEAARRKIRITSPEAFAIGRTEPPHAIRICFGLPETREKMVAGLKTLADILAAPAGSGISVV
jgi:DNA-binding transcriptional MocR family regulator